MSKWDNADIVTAAINLDWQEFIAKYPGFCSFDAWRRKRYDAANERLPLTQLARIPVEQPVIPPMEDEMHLPQMDLMYVADLHAPYHDENWVRRSIQVANVHRIGELLIGGDLFNHAKLSRHGQNGPASELETDLAVGGGILHTYLQWFEHIYIFMGNHDAWLGRKLDTNYTMERLIKSALPYGIPKDSSGNPRIVCSTREYAYMGDNFLFSHPRKYSGKGGQTPVAMAQRNQKHVLGAHNHRFGSQISDDGKWYGIDPGCMTDPKHHWYVQQAAPGQFATWTRGFVAIQDDRPWTFTEVDTPKFWARYGC